MWFTPQWRQRAFKLVQRGARQADDLPAPANDKYLFQPHATYDDNVAVIIISVGGRTTRYAGIGRLHQHDLACPDTGLNHTPLFHQRAGMHHRQRVAQAKAETTAEGQGLRRVGQDVVIPHDLAQLANKGGMCRVWRGFARKQRFQGGEHVVSPPVPWERMRVTGCR